MVLIPYVAMSSKTLFPGATALSSVIGTAFLIRYGQNGWVSRILCWRPFVATGKISYSLYLWHWPVTVFWKYATYDQLYVYDYIGMFLLSFVLAYLSWKFVELPVRTSSAWTMRRTFAFAAAGIVLLVSLGLACAYFKGWPNTLHLYANERAGAPNPLLGGRVQGFIRRLDSMTGAKFEVLHRVAEKRAALSLEWGGSGNSIIGSDLDHPQLLLIGDSHAGALRHGLDMLLRDKNIAGYVIIRAGTPLFNMQLAESQAALRKLDELPQASMVILSEQWLRYDKIGDDPKKAESVYVQLEEFAHCIKSNGKTLFIVEDVPNYKWPPNEIAARMEIIPPRKMEPEWERFQQSEEEYTRLQKIINARLEAICRKTGAVLIPLHLALKENGNYIAFAEQGEKTVPLYSDGDHLSRAGSLRAAQFIMPYLFPATGSENQP